MSQLIRSRHLAKCTKKRDQLTEQLERFKRTIEIAKGNFESSTNLNKITDLKQIDLIGIGFARTPIITRTPFSPEQISVMDKLFFHGIEIGKKYTPSQCVSIMLQTCDPLEESQIQSYWSRLKKKHNSITPNITIAPTVQIEPPSCNQDPVDTLSTSKPKSDHLQQKKLKSKFYFCNICKLPKKDKLNCICKKKEKIEC